MKYKIAWNNKYYSWDKLTQFRKQNKLFPPPKFLNKKNNIGSNFRNLKRGKIKGIIGYDSAGPLHIGSLIPLLILLETLRHYKINDVIITINDIEAMVLRGTGIEKSRYNIKNIEHVFKNLVKKYNKKFGTKIKPQFYIRSEMKPIWYWISRVLLIPRIEKIIEKHYGKIPLSHLLSVLVMTGEFLRLSKNNHLLTCYGYEELLHLSFIERIFEIMNRNFYYIICLPIRSITNKNKKMSKSDLSSGLFLMPNNRIYLNKLKRRLKKISLDNKNGIGQFLYLWSDIFKKRLSNNIDKEVLTIIQNLVK